MKKIIKYMFFLFIFFFLFVFRVKAEEIRISIVNYNGVFVRTDAGTSFTTLKHNESDILLKTNHSVTILSEKLDNTGVIWYEVSFVYYSVHYTGYIRSDLINTQTYTIEDDYGQKLIDAGFPNTYIIKLKELHAQYPNWVFKALPTKLDWEESVEAQSEIGVSLISGIRDVSYRSTSAGAYSWETDTWFVGDDPDWYAADYKVVAYYLDPRNSLTPKSIFMFESLSYNNSFQTAEVIQKILDGTFMAGSYNYNSDQKTYAQTFIDAAQLTKTSPIHLASRVRQEQGTKGTLAITGSQFNYYVLNSNNYSTCSKSASIAGLCVSKSYSGFYNFFNVGAVPSSSTNINPNWKNGLIYARGGLNGLSTSYSKPWNSIYSSILGGSQFISSAYINKGQNTLYLQKFNVSPFYKINCGELDLINIRVDAGTEYSNLMAGETAIQLRNGHLITKYEDKNDSSGVKWHNIEFLYSGVYYKGYVHSSFVAEAGYTNHTHQYMTNVEAPSSESATTYYTYNNYGILDDALTFIIPIFENMPEETFLPTVYGNPNNYLKDLKVDGNTVQNFNKDTNTYTYYVSLLTEKVTISAEAISKYSTITGTGEKTLSNLESSLKVEITAGNGEARTYTINIIKTNTIPITTSSAITTIGWLSNGNVMSKIQLNTDIVQTKQTIETINNNISLIIKNKDNNIKNEGKIGTGDIIELTVYDDTITNKAMIFGDINGDGIINGVDLINVQKHLLEFITLTDVYIQAADTTKDGKVDLYDLLRIKRHMLNEVIITQ